MLVNPNPSLRVQGHNGIRMSAELAASYVGNRKIFSSDKTDDFCFGMEDDAKTIDRLRRVPVHENFTGIRNHPSREYAVRTLLSNLVLTGHPVIESILTEEVALYYNSRKPIVSFLLSCMYPEIKSIREDIMAISLQVYRHLTAEYDEDVSRMLGSGGTLNLGIRSNEERSFQLKILRQWAHENTGKLFLLGVPESLELNEDLIRGRKTKALREYIEERIKILGLGDLLVPDYEGMAALAMRAGVETVNGHSFSDALMEYKNDQNSFLRIPGLPLKDYSRHSIRSIVILLTGYDHIGLYNRGLDKYHDHWQGEEKEFYLGDMFGRQQQGLKSLVSSLCGIEVTNTEHVMKLLPVARILFLLQNPDMVKWLSEEVGKSREGSSSVGRYSTFLNLVRNMEIRIKKQNMYGLKKANQEIRAFGNLGLTREFIQSHSQEEIYDAITEELGKVHFLYRDFLTKYREACLNTKVFY